LSSHDNRVPRRDYESKKIEDMSPRITKDLNKIFNSKKGSGSFASVAKAKALVAPQDPHLQGSNGYFSKLNPKLGFCELGKPSIRLLRRPAFMKVSLKRGARVKVYDQISLSDHCKSIICGTLLGDSCLQITKGYKNARLSIRHSEVQKEYFDWKVNNLQEIASAKSVQISKASGYGKNRLAEFQSSSLPELTMLYNLTYKNKSLCIRRRWLNRLTPLSLAIWWCDDGSIIGNPPRRGVICTDGFDEKSVRLLARYLEKLWDVHARVGVIRRQCNNGSQTKKEYFRLWFSTEELKKFLRIILPHIPVASMVYKTKLIYKDSQFQQRWISEQCAALPKFADEIQKIYGPQQSENDIVQ
jgi:LAGLIDADG DNA endonuclease family